MDHLLGLGDKHRRTFSAAMMLLIPQDFRWQDYGVLRGRIRTYPFGFCTFCAEYFPHYA